MKSYEELLAERDALIARIQAAERVEKLIGEAPELTFDDCKRLFSAEIAEIKAEAGRAGFLEGVKQMCDNEIGMLGHDAESCANHYAARVRLGFEPGTWLKDSNVNGGKRQGGAE